MWVHRAIVLIAGYLLFALALGTTYVIAQHDGRNAAEDAPRALLSAVSASGAPVGPRPAAVDLGRYQGVFWVRYDASDQAEAGDGELHGMLASVPAGVLDTARRQGEDAVTWQPEQGLRFAVVAERASGDSVVVAGQSLQRTELRAFQSAVYVALALVGGLVIVAAALLADFWIGRMRRDGLPGQRGRTA